MDWKCKTFDEMDVFRIFQKEFRYISEKVQKFNFVLIGLSLTFD